MSIRPVAWAASTAVSLQIEFGETFADDVFKKFGIADSVKAAVVVSKLGDTAGYSTYAGEFSAKLIMTWAKAQSLPPVPMIDENNAQDLVEIGLPFFVIFVESDVCSPPPAQTCACTATAACVVAGGGYGVRRDRDADECA